MRRLVWLIVVGAVVLGPAWVLFRGEPWRIESGRLNPLAVLVPALASFFAFLLGWRLVAVFRRPSVSAGWYALHIRPGRGRTLTLPWAELAELAICRTGRMTVLLIRLGSGPRLRADRPRWAARGVLRAAQRASRIGLVGPAPSTFQLAVDVGAFVGRPDDLLAMLAPYAARHVMLVNYTGGEAVTSTA
jgi:hypothetical protein